MIDRIIGIETKPTSSSKQYYLKMTNDSYRKCHWATEEELNTLSN
jgi:hypothetical protein